MVHVLTFVTTITLSSQENLFFESTNASIYIATDSLCNNAAWPYPLHDNSFPIRLLEEFKSALNYM